jgi:hypothetical protein
MGKRFRYTDVEVFAAMLRIADGEPLSRLRYRAERREGMPALTTIEQRYGGWVEACAAAGIEAEVLGSNQGRRRHTLTEAIEGVVACAQLLDRQPAPDDYATWQSKHRAYPSLWTLCQRWGWSNLMAKAGFRAP